MTISTVSTYSLPVNNKFQQKLLRNAKALAPYYVGAMPGVLSHHEGTDTVKWRRYENLAPDTSALSAISSESYPYRSGTTVSISDLTASVEKYGKVFLLNEEVDLQNFNGQTAKLVEILAIQAGRTLNQLQRNELEDNPTLIFAGNGSQDSDVANVISYAEIRNAVNVLNRNSALKFRPQGLGDVRIGTTPVRPGFVMLCHVDVEEDVRDITPHFKPVETYAGHTETYLGEFGAVHGVRCISSEDASVDADLGAGPGGGVRSTTGAAADLYTSVIFGQDAHGAVGFGVEMVKEIYQAGDSLPAIELISHGRGSAGVMDPLNELMTLGYKAWHAAKILNPTWIRGIRSAASKLV